MAPQKLSEDSVGKIADRVASILLSGRVVKDAHLDVMLAGAKAIDQYLTDAFIQTTGALIDKPEAEDTGQNRLTTYLLEEIAKLRSDVFLLKQAALKSIPPSHFTDPLVALSTRLPTVSSEATRGSSTTLRLTDKILGHGWHVERRPDGTFWRWMGPMPRATLVIPTWGPGLYSIGAEVSAMTSDQIASISISANDARVAIEVENVRENLAQVRFVAETNTNAENLIFLTFSIGAVISPSDVMDSADDRKLGIGLSHLTLTRLAHSE